MIGMTKEEKRLIKEHAIRQRAKELEASLKELGGRARSVTIGTAFGGAVELSLRGEGGVHTWAILQPIEAIELIHQMAAAVGCHISLAPRRDFASWRSWNYSQEELDHYRGADSHIGGGHPPHTKAIEPGSYGTSLPSPEEQPGMPLKEHNNGEPMAVEAPQERRVAD